MDEILQGYSEKKFDSPDSYMDKEGKDIRLAILKLNDLYKVIAESRIELAYVDKDYYNKSQIDLETNFVRYLHIKNSIYSINSIYDMGLQIPWFLYRMWSEVGIFKEKDKSKSRKIKRNKKEWINNAEELCRNEYVFKYCKLHNINKELVSLLKEFNGNYIDNKKKKFTVRTLCNSIKHKGTLQPTEIANITDDTKFNIEIKNKGKIPINENNRIELIPKAGIPKIIIKKNKQINIDILYDETKKDFSENFYGEDLYRNRYSIDEMYEECKNYLIAFKPIYDIYIKILEKDLIRLLPSPKITQRGEFNLNRFFPNKQV